MELGVALASASPGQDASTTRTLRNEQRVVISADALSLLCRAHTAFGLTNPSARPEDQREVVEFSSGAEFFILWGRQTRSGFPQDNLRTVSGTDEASRRVPPTLGSLCLRFAPVGFAGAC